MGETLGIGSQAINQRNHTMIDIIVLLSALAAVVIVMRPWDVR